MLGRGSLVAGVWILALVAGCPGPRLRPGALLVRGTNASGPAGARRNRVRIVEVPTATFTVVSATGVSRRVETRPAPAANAVVVRAGRSTKRQRKPPVRKAPARKEPALPPVGQGALLRPTCTSAYLRLLARTHRGTAIGRRAGAVADGYLLGRGIEPESAAGRMIRPDLVGTALYDSGEIPYPANPSAYGTGSHYARDLPMRPLAHRSLRRALREALKSPHHALHFQDRLRAVRRAGLLPNRSR